MQDPLFVCAASAIASSDPCVLRQLPEQGLIFEELVSHD
jgi:hypothetical protein